MAERILVIFLTFDLHTIGKAVTTADSTHGGGYSSSKNEGRRPPPLFVPCLTHEAHIVL